MPDRLYDLLRGELQAECPGRSSDGCPGAAIRRWDRSPAPGS